MQGWLILYDGLPHRLSRRSGGGGGEHVEAFTCREATPDRLKVNYGSGAEQLPLTPTYQLQMYRVHANKAVRGGVCWTHQVIRDVGTRNREAICVVCRYLCVHAIRQTTDEWLNDCCQPPTPPSPSGGGRFWAGLHSQLSA